MLWSANPPLFVRALVAPLRAWSLRTRLLAGALTVAASALLTFAIVAHLEPIFAVSDAAFYISIAQGNTAQVMHPWALRQLGALVVRAIAHLLHWTVQRSFLLEGVLSLLFTLGAVYWLMLRTAAPRWMLIAVAVLPSWVPLVQYLALPDLWYAALLSGVFLLLAGEQWMAAALMIFPLMLSRESTSLTLLCLLAAGWKTLRWRHKIVALVSAAAGSAVVSRLAAHGQTNIEQLPGPVYMAVKVPWNFLRNVLGIVPWSNVNMDLCTVPVWSMPLHFGPVQRVGVCGFSWQQELVALAVFLTSFGLLPLLLGYLWWRHAHRCTSPAGVEESLAFSGRLPWKKTALAPSIHVTSTGELLKQHHNLLLRFSLLYGGACLLLAPVLGAGFQHLEGYAWPLFLVALPLLCNEFTSNAAPLGTGRQAAASIAFFALHLAACALSYWMRLLPQILLALLLWIAGLLLLRQWWKPLEEEQYRRSPLRA